MRNLIDLNDINLSGEYWSSTEINPGERAWIQSFIPSNQIMAHESEFHKVGCVRSFGN